MIELIFAGDFIPPESSKNVFSEDLLYVLRNKDYSIVNLETPLTNCNTPIKKTGPNFKTNPKAINQIEFGFFDAVSLSNNHIRDFGTEGVMDTLDVCKNHKIKTVGAGEDIYEAKKPLKLIIKGKKIAILNFSEHESNIATKSQAGANPYDSVTAFYDIEKEKKANDYVIVIYHGGLEYQYYPTPEIVKNFKFMVDIGADAIVSHHTHRYSGTISYKGKPIIFGLGNFLAPTKTKISDGWLIGLIAKIIVVKEKIGFELIPIKMADSFDSIDLIAPNKSKAILKHVKDISKQIRNETILIDHWHNTDVNEKARIIRILKSNSKLENQIRKHIPILSSSGFPTYKSTLLLNMIRCDSKRNRLIKVLEDII